MEEKVAVRRRKAAGFRRTWIAAEIKGRESKERPTLATSPAVPWHHKWLQTRTNTFSPFFPKHPLMFSLSIFFVHWLSSESTSIFSTMLHFIPISQNPVVCHQKIICWWPKIELFPPKFSHFEYQHSILPVLEKSWAGCDWNFILGYCNQTVRAAIIQILNESRPGFV